MQVCSPTTPAQIFHLLRRQVLRKYRKPLVVMTPKNLLRHKLAVSTLEELSDSEFKAVIGEIDAVRPEAVRRVVMCAGKVYYELLEARRARNIHDVAILRIEQLNPFPDEALGRELVRYSRAKEIVWCQEEPRNQGAWNYMQPYLQERLAPKQSLHYAGRPAYAAPAAGYLSKHIEQQSELIDAALQMPMKIAEEKRIA
jgi:2-oxoglutarate dehydrogenase E1 component